MSFSFLQFSDLQWELVINRPAFPTTQDFVGSISAILRIQDVYNFSARAIADGDLHREISSGSLGPDECYELGIVSNDQRNYEDVIEWMKEALKRMSPPYEYSGALTKIDVLEYLSWAEYKVGLNGRCACEQANDGLKSESTYQSENVETKMPKLFSRVMAARSKVLKTTVT